MLFGLFVSLMKHVLSSWHVGKHSFKARPFHIENIHIPQPMSLQYLQRQDT